MFARTALRLTLALAAIGTLGACTVIPAGPIAYEYNSPSPTYVRTYPAAGYGYFYQAPPRRPPPRRWDHDHYRHDSYRSPFEDAARVHRNIRRSLGLPRLPGMP